MLTECWELLKKELMKNDINVIDVFMNYIFFDLFNELNNQISIKEYETYIKFEEKLDKLILDKIRDFKKEHKIIDTLKKSNNLSINLLEERFTEYNEYPFYNNFYYSDYINEDYLLEKLNHNEKNKYPVLKKYLEHIKSPKKLNDSLNYLNTFNKVLNLFNENYSYSITRKKAQETILKDEQFYLENKDLINEFINFYNSLNIKDEKNNELKLSNTNKLSNFFIDENNEYGKSYIKIYKKFIEIQNTELSELLDIRIENEIFNINCKNKINIQNANENEVFLLNFPKKYSFIDITFNSSFRKIIFNNDCDSYSQFEINYDIIEERMTEILLKNKKLFNDYISNFVYKNEDLIIENTDIITKFNEQFLIEEINLFDKVILYQFYDNNKENTNLFKKIFEDFIQLIIFLNNNRIQKHTEIKENEKIYEILKKLEDKISDEFRDIFKDKENLTINKTTNLFKYYLIFVFIIIKRDFKSYQIKLEENKIIEINKYFEKEHLITKDIFKNTIRLFISLFLSREKEIENKIKNNYNNIFSYLTISDIWDKPIFTKKEFNQEINEIKNLNIQINQILDLYELLGDDINDNYFDDVKAQIKRNEEIKKEKEKEEMNIPENEEKKEQEFNKDEEKEQEEEEIDDYYDKKDDDDDDDDYGGRD